VLYTELADQFRIYRHQEDASGNYIIYGVREFGIGRHHERPDLTADSYPTAATFPDLHGFSAATALRMAALIEAARHLRVHDRRIPSFLWR